MTPPSVDWTALEFACAHEADLLTKPDPEADEWYRQGNANYKAGIKTDNQELLRRAIELLHKAAERGHVKAMNNLVTSYLDGDGVKQSDAKAVEWAEELIKRNIGMGYYHMGVFLEQGVGVKQDRKAALTYMRKAADLGNAQGQLVSGDKIRKAVAQSLPEEKVRGFAIGVAMLRCALQQGLSEAGYSLGRHFTNYEEDAAAALDAYQAAAKLGHNQSLFTLQTIFGEGKYGVAKDEVRAACYKRLSDESDEDKTKKFPDIDKICPLPPKPMPRS
ncbi:MAG: sel1 repeat family protein [Rhizobacter sp.]|nr:sel1 repeat family protein [Rhizobacter sp.]